MTDLFWLLLPDSALPVVIAALGAAIMIGLIRPRRAASLIMVLIGAAVMTPFVESLFAQIPLWISGVVLFVVGMSVLRGVLESVFGREATGHIIGALAIRMIGSLIRLAALPCRLAFRVLLLVLTTRRV